MAMVRRVKDAGSPTPGILARSDCFVTCAILRHCGGSGKSERRNAPFQCSRASIAFPRCSTSLRTRGRCCAPARYGLKSDAGQCRAIAGPEQLLMLVAAVEEQLSRHAGDDARNRALHIAVRGRARSEPRGRAAENGERTAGPRRRAPFALCELAETPVRRDDSDLVVTDRARVAPGSASTQTETGETGRPRKSVSEWPRLTPCGISAPYFLASLSLP